jgi:hypothetical protein
VSGAEPPRHAAPGGEPRRVVPVYAITAGRTHSTGHELPMESLVTATERAGWDQKLENEYRMIVEMG